MSVTGACAVKPETAIHRHAPVAGGGLLVILVASLAGGCGDGRGIGEKTAEELMPLIEETAARTLVEELAPISRLPATPGFDRALDHILERLRSGGFAHLPHNPGDGLPPAGAPPAYSFIISDSLAYDIWMPGSARLEVEGLQGFTVADTRTTPAVLALNSKATGPGGVTARIYNLGNGTYPQEYEGIDVSGAVVYGRQPILDIYRAAVMERGALGVVSPSAPVWQGTGEHPEMVAVGQVGSEGFGFKISPETAAILEDAIEKGGGSVPVRATVDAARLEGRVLRTLVAEIPGSEIPLERIALIAPLSGPAPGAADVSGAAVLAEAAVALHRAIEDGRLKRPRRGIVFVWGAALMGIRSWAEHYPAVVEELHSATVVQIVGRRTESDGSALLVERVPDPASLWTRPPDSHTPWGAARPPHWPFAGHYLSELSEAVAGPAGARWPMWKVGSNPYEGGADHDFLLELLIPAQRLWNFPDPFYHSSMDTPDRTEPGLLAATTVAVAVITYEMALGDTHTARRILKLIEERARRRLSVALEQAALNLAETDSLAVRSPERRLENDILNAWKIWYLEALESVMAHPSAQQAAELRIAVSRAVFQLDTEWSEGMLALGLAPMPLPERFYMGLPRP
ncbi:MAG: hypothetical protein KAT18_01635 [Candidatus Latescibacteria bacterium]|nr:hypothetical protein [Candidatus Latescibacterota bacterium]